MVAEILTKLLSAEPFERNVGNITGMNNCNANCAEAFWTVKAGEEYHSGDEEGMFWLVRYRTITLMS